MQNCVLEVHLGDYQRSKNRMRCESMLIYGIMTLWNAVGAPSINRKDDIDLDDLNLYICQYWSRNIVLEVHLGDYHGSKTRMRCESKLI